MTTNHPDKLDAALVRPGRVDRKVEFKLAARSEVEELFVRMYRVDDEPGTEGEKDRKFKAATTAGDKAVKQDSDTSALAVRFASHVPESTFTPAEIQNHLMKYKKDPRQAVDTAEKWKTDLLETKAKTNQKQGHPAAQGVKLIGTSEVAQPGGGRPFQFEVFDV